MTWPKAWRLYPVYGKIRNLISGIASNGRINRIVLYDITGNVVYRSRAKATETRVSTSDLSTGIYILRIDTNKGIFKKKLQVQK